MRVTMARVVVMAVVVVCCHAQRYGHECETLPSNIHVTQEERDERGRLVRTCEEDVRVSKCEGACPSKVQPSVNTLSGFYKDCRCCRETTLRHREITLSHCYDADGKALAGDRGSMRVSLKEPSDCDCFKCGDPTR